MNSVRDLVESLDRQFAELHSAACDLISRLAADSLYAPVNEDPAETCAHQALRSAAAIEQSFGGLTANLWDDPFEWTLPETLNTPAKVLEYLDEVEELRNRAFLAFTADADLSKEIMTPAGATKILPFLLDTLERARHHQQRAFKVFEALTTD